MAVKVESLAGIRIGTPSVTPQAPPTARLLSRQERLAQVRWRRRTARFQGILEGALWIGGSGALITVCIAGLFGLR